MGSIIEYTKAQLKHKLAHPVKAAFLFFMPLVLFAGAYVGGLTFKQRETPDKVPETKPSFHGILVTVVVFFLYILYCLTCAYDVVRERQMLRKQHMLANGLTGLQFYWAWIFVYAILMLPTTIVIIAVVAMSGLFPHVSAIVMFVEFFLFQVSGTTVAFWVSSYAPIPIVASFIVLFFNLSFAGAYFGMAYMPKATKDILCLFVSPMTIGAVIDSFAHVEINAAAGTIVPITAKNLIPFLGGKYSIFNLTFKLIFNNILYVSFGMLFEKLYQYLNRNKFELKKREYYENDVKANVETVEAVNKTGARVTAEHVYKTYFGKKIAPVDALKNVNFEVYKNEIFAVVGREGAGKSTLLKLIAGRTISSYGDVKINAPYGKNQTQFMSTVGSVAPQDDYTVFELATVGNNVEFYKAICKDSRVNVNDLLNELNFNGNMTDKYCDLDVIDKAKLKVALALLCDKEVVILDEPTTGMTEKDAESFWKVIAAHRDGKAIIVSTTYLKEAEQHADRVLVLENGRVSHNTNGHNEFQVKVEL